MVHFTSLHGVSTVGLETTGAFFALILVACGTVRRVVCPALVLFLNDYFATIEP